MKKIGASLAIFLLLILILSACNGEPQKTTENTTDNNTTVGFMRKRASIMNDETGWYYCFTYEQDAQDTSKRIYYFIGTNLRYRYNESYWSVTWNKKINSDGTVYWAKIMNKPGSLVFGEGGEAQLRDRVILDSIMDASHEPDDLLALKPENYQFETLDRDLVFNLIRETLTGDPLPDTGPMDYWMKPAQSMDVEPDYQDGYKFQIGFCMKNFLVDEIYIDILYKTGEAYNDYNQLSDLVEGEKATADQEEAFMLIQKIRTAIKEENSFVANADMYKDLVIGNIHFSRLYTFLWGIHTNTLEGFNNNSENAPFEVETLSEEEYNALSFK